MKLRQFSIVLAVVLVVCGIGGCYVLVQMRKPQDKIDARIVSAVSVQSTTNGDVQLSIPLTGQLVAKNRIEIFAEVSGVVLPANGKAFREGVSFRAGESLLRIDSRETQNTLLAQRSQLLNLLTTSLPDLKIDFPDAYPKWQTYVDQFELNATTPELPAVASSKEKFFVSSRNIYNLFYQLKGTEVRLQKHVVTAPFDGVVTTAMIDHGAMIRAGQKVGEYISPGNYELEATASLAEAAMLNPGDTVMLHSKELSGNWTGIISRINDQIDPGTQSIKLYVAVEGPRLKEGLFMEAAAEAKTVASAMSIPRSLLVDRNKVYVVENDQLDLVEVEVLQYSEDQAVIRGLAEGTALLTTRVAGAYEGMVVNVQQ